MSPPRPAPLPRATPKATPKATAEAARSAAAGHAPLSAAQVRAVAARFQALAAPSRLRVLNTLMQGPLGLGALAQRAGLSLSNASRQVAALEAAGCVERRRDGREVTVAIADPTLVDLCALVCGAIAQRARREQAALGAGTRRAPARR